MPAGVRNRLASVAVNGAQLHLAGDEREVAGDGS
jgi:hypothetical protein